MPRTNAKLKNGKGTKVRLANVLPKFPIEIREAISARIPEDERTGIEIDRVPHALGEIKGSDDEKRQVSAYISTRTVDRSGDIMIPEGVVLDDYRKNPIVLVGHNYSMTEAPPVAKAIEIKVDPFGVLATMEFADTPRADEYFQLVKGGFLRAYSIGFRALNSLWRDDDGFSALLDSFESEWPEFDKAARDRVRRICMKWDLWEFSIVNIPDNPDALAQAIAKGDLALSDETKTALDLERSEPPPKDPPPEPKAPDPKPIEIRGVITEHRPAVPIIREVITPKAIADLAAGAVQKRIDKIRGAV